MWYHQQSDHWVSCIKRRASGVTVTAQVEARDHDNVYKYLLYHLHVYHQINYPKRLQDYYYRFELHKARECAWSRIVAHKNVWQNKFTWGHVAIVRYVMTTEGHFNVRAISATVKMDNNFNPCRMIQSQYGMLLIEILIGQYVKIIGSALASLAPKKQGVPTSWYREWVKGCFRGVYKWFILSAFTEFSETLASNRVNILSSATCPICTLYKTQLSD